MKNGGLKMDAEYFEERTGIPVTEIEEQDTDQGLKPEQKKKLKNLYK